MDRMVEDHELEDRYFERMAASLGDKERLLQFFPPVTNKYSPTVLDIGAGGGEFANVLSELGYNVTALDVNEDSLHQISYKFPTIKTLRALANHVNDYGENVYDVIVCSSVLHEVASYGDDVHSIGHISSIKRALKSFYKALKPGGKLIIRDGVLPDNWKEPAALTLNDTVPVESVTEYLRLCPFANGTAYGEQGSLISLKNTSGRVWTGNVRSVLEFAYTFTWGMDSYSRETQEIYAWFTVEEYKRLLEQEGYKVLTGFSYLQPGYPEHLEEKLTLTVNDEPAEWFDSNAIWVGEKQ